MVLTNIPKAAVAILAMVGASALVAVTTLIAKSLGVGGADTHGLSPFQVSAGRFVFAFLTLLFVVMLRPKLRPSVDGTAWRWHLLRSLSGWSGITCMFAAAARMPLAEATSISFLSPLVTMAIAIILLGESITIRKFLAAAIALLGGVLILRPGTEAFQPAAFFALGAAVLLGTESIFIKKLSDTEPAMRILLINNGIGATVSIIVASFVWSPPGAEQWVLLVALGAFMVSGQALYIQSMKRGAASQVAPAFYSVLLFATLYDFIIFGVLPVFLAVVGAILILVGVVMLSLTPRHLTARSDYLR